MLQLLSEVVCISIRAHGNSSIFYSAQRIKDKISIREALHVSKQMYHFHVYILTHSACGSGTPRIVVIVHFRILTYFHLLTSRYSADKLYTLVCTSGTVAIRLKRPFSCVTVWNAELLINSVLSKHAVQLACALRTCQLLLTLALYARGTNDWLRLLHSWTWTIQEVRGI